MMLKIFFLSNFDDLYLTESDVSDLTSQDNGDDVDDMLSVSSLASDLIVPSRSRNMQIKNAPPEAPKVKLYRQSNGVTLDIPWKFGNLLAKGFNNHDHINLRRIFREYCTPDCQVIKHVYSSTNPKTKNPKNYFGKYSTATMDIGTFAEYSKNFDLIVPDSIMDVHNHRSCYEREVSVFMSAFTYNGTIIVQDSQLAEPDQNGQINGVKSKEDPKKLQLCYQEGQVKPFNSQGSMGLYVNKDGLIYCIEFFYEFL